MCGFLLLVFLKKRPKTAANIQKKVNQNAKNWDVFLPKCLPTKKCQDPNAWLGILCIKQRFHSCINKKKHPWKTIIIFGMAIFWDLNVGSECNHGSWYTAWIGWEMTSFVDLQAKTKKGLLLVTSSLLLVTFKKLASVLPTLELAEDSRYRSEHLVLGSKSWFGLILSKLWRSGALQFSSNGLLSAAVSCCLDTGQDRTWTLCSRLLSHFKFKLSGWSVSTPLKLKVDNQSYYILQFFYNLKL